LANGITKKLVVKDYSLAHPPHFNTVATLPCEI